MILPSIHRMYNVFFNFCLSYSCKNTQHIWCLTVSLVPLSLVIMKAMSLHGMVQAGKDYWRYNFLFLKLLGLSFYKIDPQSIDNNKQFDIRLASQTFYLLSLRHAVWRIRFSKSGNSLSLQREPIISANSVNLFCSFQDIRIVWLHYHITLPESFWQLLQVIHTKKLMKCKICPPCCLCSMLCYEIVKYRIFS